MVNIDTNKRVARKEHECNYCYGIIKIGEIYENQTNRYDGNIYHWKAHLKCQEITGLLGLHDDNCEGVTDDLFQEAVNEKFSDLSIRQKHYDFQKRIDEVYKYLKKNMNRNSEIHRAYDEAKAKQFWDNRKLDQLQNEIDKLKQEINDNEAYINKIIIRAKEQNIEL